METKNCPKCKFGMEKGRLLNNGLVWTGSKKFYDIYDTCVKGCEALPAYGVMAYRCSKCNNIELYTVKNEKA